MSRGNAILRRLAAVMVATAPGQVRKVVTIKAVPDDIGEGGLEEFYGYVLASVGAPIDRSVATFTIHDE